MLEIAYFLMLAFLLSHEIDAAYRKEWRVLPLTSWMPDTLGRQVFILAHVPLLAAIFLGGGLSPSSTFAAGLSAFSVVHVGLHWLFRHHKDHDFNNWLSVLLIVGAGVAGLVHLVLLWVF